jgi:hypothetical protein
MKMGVMFWLLGAYMLPLFEFYLMLILKCKNIKQNIHTYIFTCYMRRELFHEKLFSAKIRIFIRYISIYTP